MYYTFSEREKEFSFFLEQCLGETLRMYSITQRATVTLFCVQRDNRTPADVTLWKQHSQRDSNLEQTEKRLFRSGSEIKKKHLWWDPLQIYKKHLLTMPVILRHNNPIMTTITVTTNTNMTMSTTTHNDNDTNTMNNTKPCVELQISSSATFLPHCLCVSYARPHITQLPGPFTSLYPHWASTPS